MRFNALLLAVLCLNATSGLAQIDCTPLDPRASVSKETNGKAKVEADGIFKLAHVSGDLGGTIRNEIQNLSERYPLNDQSVLIARTQYFLCELFRDDNTMTTGEKAKAVTALLQQDERQEPPRGLSRPIPFPPAEPSCAPNPPGAPGLACKITIQ